MLPVCMLQIVYILVFAYIRCPLKETMLLHGLLLSKYSSGYHIHIYIKKKRGA